MQSDDLKGPKEIFLRAEEEKELDIQAMWYNQTSMEEGRGSCDAEKAMH